MAVWAQEVTLMGAKKGLTPGTKAPASGQYPILGSRGGNTGTERTVVKGEPLPPTPQKGQTYGSPDRTKNGAGTGSRKR